MLKQLRLKFVCIVMAIVTIMLSLVFGMVIHFMKANLEEQSIRLLRSISDNPFQQGNPGDVSEEVQLPYFTVLLSYRGQLVAKSGGYYDLSDEVTILKITRAALESGAQSGVLEEYNLRYYRTDSPMRPCLVFADISSEQATLDGLIRTCLLIGGCSFLAFLWISVLLSRWAVRPVDAAWKRQRQFVASASHELKTPLTVILTNAELLQDPTYSPERRSVFLSNLLTMSRQMRHLIEQLLELARADAAAPQAARLPVDFSALVSRSVLSFEPVFFERGLTLIPQVDERIQVLGEAAPLEQVVNVLLDNAQKYAREHGRVWVRLQMHGRDRCLLSVSNEGDPIPPEDLPHIFERFYRADPARSRDGSFGLGLSIAKAMVVRHQGKIWAESSQGVNRFLVELPRIKSTSLSQE